VPWLDVAGSNTVRLIEPTYTMRIVWKTDANDYLDYYRFDSAVPVEELSWGAIKSLYSD
jgi:hypothetical protein